MKQLKDRVAAGEQEQKRLQDRLEAAQQEGALLLKHRQREADPAADAHEQLRKAHEQLQLLHADCEQRLKTAGQEALLQAKMQRDVEEALQRDVGPTPNAAQVEGEGAVAEQQEKLDRLEKELAAAQKASADSAGVVKELEMLKASVVEFEKTEASMQKEMEMLMDQLAGAKELAGPMQKAGSNKAVVFDFDCTLSRNHLFKTVHAGYYLSSRGRPDEQQGMAWGDLATKEIGTVWHQAPTAVFYDWLWGGASRLAALKRMASGFVDGGVCVYIATAGYASEVRLRPNQCAVSVQSVDSQWTVSVQSVYSHCAVSAQSVHSQCTVSAQTVHSQCTVSCGHSAYSQCIVSA